ncbi:MAG: DEAD/DEAH box helicase [Candidatus Pedobacter colombiensis]|uniref:DEAD/DEAH box helicase n=1 Tax=Candidatus Pedobacter colombiensis TaxID=3121371 RepID=A0AAJ5W8Y5_9SPHI|nr:DEAD/DEAH box helicase [Pedobacter sp.]WEK20212.1 MAG: DEAD/DEAH box helicase [Pedobacter sp.]
MNNGGSSNSIFDKVLSFIDYSNQSIFLTGKAGTGKTTLLKRIKETSSKKMAVIAPTGVAAMNAKGTTINSFFQLPPGSFFPGDISLENLQSGILSIQSMVSDLSYSREKTSLFNELELLIIDEVSMVRCDLLDVIDAILRAVRKNNAPFGGVQLLLIGDLYQLPPVTKREDWAFLSRAYPSPYFFDALVIRKNPVLQIELSTVFRQTEPEFINILNDIRNNQIDESGLELLNKRYNPTPNTADEVSPIIITSHNAEANSINKEKLDELTGTEYTFEGEVSGEFRDLGLQAEQSLKLKEGAQIMFIKNDTGENRKFYNGKIGKVKSVKAGEIYISFPNEEDFLLEKTSWQSFEYKTDTEEAIVQQQVGEFSQYPIKLAWAVTIHKSQGLTFDSAIIDAGKSFVAGQVYVALSRVRTLNGLILKSKISTESLRSNTEVLNYMNPAKETELDNILITAQESFILQLVLNHFSFSRIYTGLETMAANPDVVKSILPEFKSLLAQLNKSVTDLLALSDRFQNQVKQLHKQNGFKEQQALQARIESALTYFIKELNLQLINQLNKNIRIKPKNKIQQQLQHLMQKYRQVIENRIALMQYASGLLKDPIKAEDYTSWINKHKAKASTKPSSSSPAQQSAVNLQLF